MVGAVEEKLCPAGDGAEFSDHQPVVVDGIVIQHIVPLKSNGVMDKVVIHSVVSHEDMMTHLIPFYISMWRRSVKNLSVTIAPLRH